MILTLNGIDYTVNNPKYGTQVVLTPAIIRNRILPRGYSLWDNGITNDNRVSTFEFSLSAEHAEA
jgi:hypothetical protein